METDDQKTVAKNFEERIIMMQKDKPVIIQPNSEPCFDFTTDGYERLKKTVIISPIRIEEYDNNKFKVTYGCSRGIFCKDVECRYAKCLGIKKVEEDPVIGIEAFSSQLDR